MGVFAALRTSSIAACASCWYSATEPSCSSSQTATSLVGAAGWSVRIGRPRYACIESAEMSSAGNRDANSSATDVFPEAVGPNSASTKSSCMPRLWSLRSSGRADTSPVKLPHPFAGRTHLDRRPHELAAFIAFGAALSAAAGVGVSWAAGFGAVAVHQPGRGLTMPWAIAVPTGGVLALAALRLRDRLRGRDGWRDHVAQWLDSIHVIKQLFVKLEHAAGPIGTGIYWFGDIACLAFCLRAFEGHFPSIAPLLIGYATGYALTRRTLPLAGAGAVEALLPFALLWSGTPLAAAVPAVVAYRMVNFWLPIVPAIFGLRSLRADGRAARARG